MSQATILVTGGLGYIGSHTAVALLQAGYRVLVIDNLANTSLVVLDRIEAITGTRPPFSLIDLQDMARVRQFFLESPPIHAVIHFAAHKSVPESVANPLQYYQNNLVSLLNLLQVSRAHGKPLQRSRVDPLRQRERIGQSIGPGRGTRITIVGSKDAAVHAGGG